MTSLKVLENDSEQNAGPDEANRPDPEVPATANRPDPEVPATAKRRRFSAKKKLEILNEIDERKKWGLELGSVLRREGIYSAQISKWRKAREAGKLRALQPKKRGRRPDPDAQIRRQLKQAQAENDRLRKDLEQAVLIIDVQKKLSRLLGLGDVK